MDILLSYSPRRSRFYKDWCKKTFTIAANNDTVAEVEDNLFLQEALSLLTPEQKKVILATVLEGVTEQKAAKKLGMSQQAVNRIKTRALNRLRKHFIQDKPTAECHSL